MGKFDEVYRVGISVRPQESSFGRALRELDRYNNQVYQQAVLTPQELHKQQVPFNPPHMGQKIDILA